MQDHLVVPIFPLLGRDGSYGTLQLVHHNHRQEVYEYSCLHHIFRMDPEAVAVHKVLHVVKVQLDGIALAIVKEGLGCILLMGGQEHPVAAVPTDVGINHDSAILTEGICK